MKTISLGNLPLLLFVGYEGENDARGFSFDYSSWTEEYGAGVLQMLLQRPGDANPYPVLLTAGENGTAVWQPSATDTDAKGKGEIQLIYTVGQVIAKTAVMTVLIDRSLGAGTTPPDPYETWVEELIEIGNKILQDYQAPKIVGGYWYEFDTDLGEYVNTGVKAEGQDGVGISSAVLNADYTLTLTFSDGTSYTTPSIRGEQGTQGETGATPALSIGTIATLPAGSPATAEMTGTPEAPVLNLGIPQGLKGDAGNGDMIADDFSTSTNYAAGDYVIYSGHLYHFTAAHSAGAWTGTDAVQAQLAEYVADLNRAFDVHYLLTEEGSASFAPPSAQYINASISSATGQVTNPSEARAASPYIEIPLNSGATWSVAAGYAFTFRGQYDKDKNYLGQFGNDLMAETRFMRFCIKRTDDGNISASEAASAFSISYTYNDPHIKKVTGKNLLDQSKAEVGYISNNTGSIASSTIYHTSDYIFVPANQPICISPSVRIFLAYNLLFQPITTSYMNTETNDYTYTPSQDVFIRFSYRDANALTTQAEYGSAPTSYMPYQIEVEPEIRLNDAMRTEIAEMYGSNSIIGKKFLLFGDSIMHGAGNSNYGVGDILTEKFHMTFWDYCESGALVEYLLGQTETPVYQQIQNAISANREPDFIIMDGLSNDIAHGTLGTMSTDFDYAAHGYNDFSSALEYCFGLLKDNYPVIPVLYVIPHSSAARVYATELSFGNRAREICQKWSIPIADVYRDGNMNGRIEEQKKLFTSYPDETSGTHPNRDGYDYAYMPLIENWLMNIFARME